MAIRTSTTDSMFSSSSGYFFGSDDEDIAKGYDKFPDQDPESISSDEVPQLCQEDLSDLSLSINNNNYGDARFVNKFTNPHKKENNHEYGDKKTLKNHKYAISPKIPGVPIGEVLVDSHQYGNVSKIKKFETHLSDSEFLVGESEYDENDNTPQLSSYELAKIDVPKKAKKNESDEIRKIHELVNKTTPSADDWKLIRKIKKAIRNQYPKLKLTDAELEKEIKFMVVYNNLYPESQRKIYASGSQLPLTFQCIGKSRYLIHLKTKMGESVLGKGNFKIVYKSLDVDLSAKKVEVLTHQKPKSLEAAKEMKKEATLQSSLHNKNIMPINVLVSNEESFTFYSELGDTSLQAHLKNKQSSLKSGVSLEKKDFANRVAIVKEVASGVKFLHRKNLCHNDLKTDNVLLAKGQWKLNDLGLTASAGTVLESWCRLHLAPEQRVRVEKDKIPPMGTKETDVYAFGILIYEVFAGEFPRSHNYPILDEAIIFAGWPNDKKTAALKSIISSCLNKDPAKRPTIAKVKEQLKSL